mgnify:FL=1
MPYTTVAHINSLKGEVDEITVLEQFGDNGKFDEVWKLSALLLRKGCKLIDIVEVDNKAIEINIDPPAVDKTNLIIRAVAKGKPQFVPVSHNGIRYNAIQIDNKMYISDKYKRA